MNIDVNAVNAYAGDEHDQSVIVAVREPDGSHRWTWHQVRMSRDHAIQLADQLRLLTRTTD